MREKMLVVAAAIGGPPGASGVWQQCLVSRCVEHVTAYILEWFVLSPRLGAGCILNV